MSLVRKHVPDSEQGWMFAVTFVVLGRPGEARHPRPRFVIPAIGSMPRTPIRGRNPEGKGGTNHTQTLPATRPPFSYLGVPAPAGVSDWYENRSPPSSFVRKSALQSTSMPALHRRNVPNCRLMVDGGMRKCSAGACPPQGLGWGVAESAVPILCTKPQFRLFTPWCAGASRHERLL